jgi:hypothetical protein
MRPCLFVGCVGPRCGSSGTALRRSGENVHTSMIVIEIRQVTNEALLKTMQPARVLVATKASAVGQCP